MASIRFNFFFEYIFYRTTKFFIKLRLTGTGIGYSSILYLSLIQFTALLDLLEIIGLLVSDGVPVIKFLGEDYKTFSIVLMIFLFFINYKMLNGKYYTLHQHWSHESKKAHFWKGFLVIISLLGPVVLFVILMESMG